MAIKNNQIEILIKEAKIEERNNYWEKAANLYEQVAKLFLEKKLLQDAAKIYDKLGFIYLRTVFASEIREDYLNWNKKAVKAFKKAESLFDKSNENLLSLECKAKALAQMCFVIPSIEDARKNIKKSVDILFELIEEYSKAKDMKNFLRLSALSVDPMLLFISLFSNPSELEYYSQLGANLMEKA